MENLDRNGYGLSLLQDDESRCYLCGNRAGKLDRHEIYGASNRKKSKELGFWVTLCHEPCHRLAHGDRAVMDLLHFRGQIAAMNTYGWSKEDFRNVIGRNYL